MKTKYAIILTALVCLFLIILNVFLVSMVSPAFEGVVLSLVLGWQIKKIYMYFKNGG